MTVEELRAKARHSLRQRQRIDELNGATRCLACNEWLDPDRYVEPARPGVAEVVHEPSFIDAGLCDKCVGYVHWSMQHPFRRRGTRPPRPNAYPRNFDGYR